MHKIRFKWSRKESIGYTKCIKSGSYGFERSQLGTHNAKIKSYGLERSQLCTQW